jgi:CSLREA domain-containing protein
VKLVYLSVAVVLLLCLLPAAVAQASSTITVNTTAQSPGAAGDCTLGEAIQAANTDATVDGCAAGSGADTIVLPAGQYDLTIRAEDDCGPACPTSRAISRSRA